ncbi:MAG TPA: hypothetical protein DCW86_01565 [Actinobacteria bacterium]|nr:hypothetical protein [Actinomycetota bacterium]
MKGKLRNNTIFTIIAANSGLFILLGAIVFITFVAAPWVESVVLARLPQPQPPGEEQPRINGTVNVFTLDRGNGHPNNNHLAKALEAASHLVKHEANAKINLERGDFSAFDPFEYDVLILQDYRKYSGEAKLLENEDAATSTIAAFAASGKTVIAMGCPFLQDNATLREVFGIYFVDENPKGNTYVIDVGHPLVDKTPSPFITNPRDINPYGWAMLEVDGKSNPTVEIIVQSDLGEPAVTVADYRQGKAIALSFINWTPLPAFDTPISQYRECNRQVGILANAIAWSFSEEH